MKRFYVILVALLIGLSTSFSAFGQETTWYALNSGEWNEHKNWTQDPAAAVYVNPGNEYPDGPNDNVVVNTGVIMTLPTGENSITLNCGSITIDGRLDLGTTTGHSFTEIRGSGRILMQGDNFPSGDNSHFVSEGKGTLVLQGNTFSISGDQTFYNVEVDMNVDNTLILAGDLTVDGNLDVLSGGFQFGDDATNRTLTVKGNVTVDAGAGMSVLDGPDAAHQMFVEGNITNNGTIQFTNILQPAYDSTPTDGYVVLTAGGESNKTLFANNTTNLQRLIVNKGSDRTYRFTVNPTQKEYFRLFGQNDNAVANKALVIENGTLELTGATYIHSLTEGVDFQVPVTGALWINGGSVDVNTTAINASADGFDATGVDTSTGGAQSFSLYGLFRISDGLFNTRSHGFVAWDDGNAMVQVDGGTVKTPGFRSAGGNTGKWTYNQSAGTVEMYGGMDSDLDGQNEATFSVKGGNNVFIMTGGVMEIQDAATDGDLAIDIESGEGKYSVTGGKVRINRVAGGDKNFNISSTAPFYKLEIEGINPTDNADLFLKSDLTVLDSLIVKDYGSLDATTANYAINISGDFTVDQNAGTINFRNNITSFAGVGNSNLENNSGTNLDFYDLEVSKDSEVDTVFLSIRGAQVRNDLLIEKGDMDLQEQTLSVKGNINIEKGNIISTGETGLVNLNGTGVAQQLYSRYRKDYSFGNIDINNNVELLSHALVKELSFGGDHIVDLGIYNLEIEVADYTVGTWSGSRMFRTAGNASDGGLTLPVILDGNYNDDLVQKFPIGVDGGYSPAEVYVQNNLTASGNITVKPVNSAHPTVSDEDYALDYFWRVTSEGLDGIEDDLRFRFVNYEGINVPNYQIWPFTDKAPEGIVFNNNEWVEYGTGVMDGDELLFPYNSTLTKDFSFGVLDAAFLFWTVLDPPRTLYSKQTGNFKGVNTWTENEDHESGNADPPTAIDYCIVHQDHTVTINANNAEASQAEINGVLNVAAGTTGHNIDVISGTGRLTYNGSALINGDHSEFCNNASAIFEYSGGQYTLPEDIYNYPNLEITGAWAKTIGNIDITASSLLVDGPILNMSNSDYGDVEIEGNITIKQGVNNGRIRFMNSGSERNLTVNGNIEISDIGRLIVQNPGAVSRQHSIIVYGDIHQGDGRINIYKESGGITNTVNVIFEGDESSKFTKTGASASSFGRIVVNKPAAQPVLLEGDLSLDAPTNDLLKPLELQSGIVNVNHPDIAIELSSAGDFKIPGNSELIVSKGIVSLAGIDAGIWLDGKLTINDGGTANFNQGTNNYIEYTASGNSVIEVNGSGELYIGSQLRRSVLTEAGILKFSQNGSTSTIVIGDMDAPETTRGVFEILNNGSSFTQAAGATLTIKNSKDGGFTDFYFDPEIVSLGDGSTINIAEGTWAGSMDMYVNKPLENLSFTGIVAGVLKTVPVEILGNLSIGASSTFNANGLDVTIFGNMTNDGTFIPDENTTFFSGSVVQTITGNTTFYNLVKNQGTSKLQIGESTIVTVGNDLTINTGIFDTGANEVSVKGDVFVDQSASTASSGDNLYGIVMNGETSQKLSGGGTIARLKIDHASGVIVSTQSSAIRFSNVLKLKSGVLDIGRNLLIIEKDATIEGDATDNFSATNMVQTNLSFVDAGVRKFFPAGAGDFTYPVGAGGKFTPVVVDVTANTSDIGYIGVTPANEPHVSIAEADLGNVLQYTWTLKSSDLDGFTGGVKFEVMESDALTDGYTRDDYIAARILEGTTEWLKPATSLDEVTGELIEGFEIDGTIARMRFLLSDESQISGDYTAGVSIEDDYQAIPDEVPAFYTASTGVWDDTGSWVTGSVPSRGSVVYINHDIEITNNFRSVYRTYLNENGVLSVGNTINHRLGSVRGTGRLVLESGNMPAGVYEEFFSPDGGTLEYSGTLNYDVLSEITAVNNLVFSGSGIRNLPNLERLIIYGDVFIEGTTQLVNEYTDKTQEIRGNITIADNAAFDAKQGKVVLAGGFTQSLSGDFVGNAFYDLEIDNTDGITLNNPVVVENILTFTSGVLRTSVGAELTVTNPDNSSVLGASTTRYVDGPMRKQINSGTKFDFPIGNSGRYGFVGVKPAATGVWETQYFNTAHADRNNTDGVAYVSNNEYWSVNAPATANAEITLRWDAQSGVNPDDNSFQVIDYDGADGVPSWSSIAYKDKNGDLNGGTITSNDALTFNTWRLFTFGASEIASYPWLGKSSDWFDTNNWGSGELPSASTQVEIPTATEVDFMPVLDGNASCMDLTINTGATVTIKSESILEVANNLTNNGKFIFDTDFGKAPAAMIPPIDNTDAGEGDFYINNLPVNAWIKLGHPVESAPASIYKVGGTAEVDSWIYRVFNGWQQITNPDLILKDMGGINVWYAPKNDSTNYDLHYNGTINTGQSIYEVEGGGYYLLGNPFTSAIDWQNEDGNGWDRPFNVGSTMWQRVHVGDGISDYEFAYNRSTGVPQIIPTEYGFTEENVSHIAPFQSVWIYVDDKEQAHVQVDNKARVRSDLPLKRASSETKSYDIIRVKTKRTNQFLDGTVLYFDETFDSGIDYSDSEKKLNSTEGYPEVFTKAAGKRLGINGMPALGEEHYAFPLVVRNRVEGSVSMRFTLDQFNADYDVLLEDREKGIWTNVKVLSEYHYSPTELGTNEDRFVIHLQKVKEVPTNLDEQLQNENEGGIEIAGYNDYAKVSINSNLLQSAQATIELLDVNGRLILSRKTTNTETEITLPEQNGVYIVRVKVGSTVKTGKVVRR